MFTMLIKLSENDKRVLIAICLIVLLIIVLVGYLSLLVRNVMRRQGKKVDFMMYDIMKARVIVDSKTFGKVARYKSNVYFLKKTWVPLLILAVFISALLIYGTIIGDIGLKYFAKSINTLSFGFVWPMGEFFGLHVPVDWPTITHYPDLSFEFGKYLSYVCLMGLTYGGIKFFICIQSLIARELRISSLKKTYFTKDLNKLSELQN